MLEGAVIALVSLAIGVVLGRRTKKPSYGQEIARCACKHVRSMHADEGKGKCWYVDINNWWWVQEADGSTKKRSCPCQHYDGPEPLPTFYAPEISE